MSAVSVKMLRSEHRHRNRQKQTPERHDLLDPTSLRQLVFAYFDQADDQQHASGDVHPEHVARHPKRREPHCEISRASHPGNCRAFRSSSELTRNHRAWKTLHVPTESREASPRPRRLVLSYLGHRRITDASELIRRGRQFPLEFVARELHAAAKTVLSTPETAIHSSDDSGTRPPPSLPA